MDLETILSCVDVQGKINIKLFDENSNLKEEFFFNVDGGSIRRPSMVAEKLKKATIMYVYSENDALQIEVAE